MVPLYAARIGNLKLGDLLIIECVCGRTERLTARVFAIAGAYAGNKIMDFAPRLRCRGATIGERRLCRSGGLSSSRLTYGGAP